MIKDIIQDASYITGELSKSDLENGKKLLLMLGFILVFCILLSMSKSVRSFLQNINEKKVINIVTKVENFNFIKSILITLSLMGLGIIIMHIDVNFFEKLIIVIFNLVLILPIYCVIIILLNSDKLLSNVMKEFNRIKEKKEKIIEDKTNGNIIRINNEYFSLPLFSVTFVLIILFSIIFATDIFGIFLCPYFMYLGIRCVNYKLTKLTLNSSHESLNREMRMQDNSVSNAISYPQSFLFSFIIIYMGEQYGVKFNINQLFSIFILSIILYILFTTVNSLKTDKGEDCLFDR